MASIASYRIMTHYIVHSWSQLLLFLTFLNNSTGIWFFKNGRRNLLTFRGLRGLNLRHLWDQKREINKLSLLAPLNQNHNEGFDILNGFGCSFFAFPAKNSAVIRIFAWNSGRTHIVNGMPKSSRKIRICKCKVVNLFWLEKDLVVPSEGNFYLKK